MKKPTPISITSHWTQWYDFSPPKEIPTKRNKTESIFIFPISTISNLSTPTHGTNIMILSLIPILFGSNPSLGQTTQDQDHPPTYPQHPTCCSQHPFNSLPVDLLNSASIKETSSNQTSGYLKVYYRSSFQPTIYHNINNTNTNNIEILILFVIQIKSQSIGSNTLKLPHTKQVSNTILLFCNLHPTHTSWFIPPQHPNNQASNLP